MHVEPAGGGEQRIGGDHAVALRADEPGARGHQVLLGVEHVERRALAGLRLLLHAGERDGGGAHLGLPPPRARSSRPSCVTQAPITAVWAWLRICSSTMRACIAISLAWRICEAASPPS